MSFWKRKKIETIVIDCLEMEPPQPLIAVLDAADNLKEGQQILMINRHPPGMLFSQLSDRRFKYHLETKEDGHVEVMIWKDKF